MLQGLQIRRMKITNISTLVVNARMRNWVLVKVETDQPGLYGWGEATLEWKTKSVVGAVEDLSVLLIGQDPRTNRAPLADHAPSVLLARRHYEHDSDERHRSGAVGYQR